VTCIVTGANSGLGLITARELAATGEDVVIACRDTGRGEEAATRIRDRAPEASVEVAQLDLADLASVRGFARDFGECHRQLDLLVNNAGLMALPRRRTTDGFEMHFGVNHLGHFVLTGLVLDRLLASAAPRVVTVTSFAHRMWRISFGNLDGKRGYWRWAAYAQSKLANLLFAYELQRRAEAAGAALRSVAAHPGYARTRLQTGAARVSRGPLTLAEAGVMMVTNTVLAQSAEEGARPIVHAATASDLPGGSFVGPRGPLGLRGRPRVVGSSRRSRDPDAARRLWEVSEELTGVRYAFTG
jgi:NAD(P)-dependent dehydrogenase (short-subunit alcohol dehydrogenase family)